MSRRIKTLVAAMGVFVLLGGGYCGFTIWENRKAASKESSYYSPPAELGNLDSTELVRIEASGITLEKNNGIWELTYLERGIPPDGIELDQMQINLLAFPLATVWVESIVDEKPEDLSVYGLDNPSTRTIITDFSGRKVEYILGDMTPSRTSYYIMEVGDPQVYTISVQTANVMRVSLDSIRNRNLFPFFELSELTELRITSAGRRIEICPKEISLHPYLAALFATHVLTSPYKLPRGASNEELNSLIAPLKRLLIADFIDDTPLSLEPYGLDKPVRVSLQAENISGEKAAVDFMIGNQINGKHYAKLTNAPGIFTLGNMKTIVDAKPFNLFDKYILLVNIDWVDHLTISGGERTLSADFQGSGDEREYFLNGRKAEDRSFKSFYEAVIGLLADAEYPGGPSPRQNEEPGKITIEYQLNTPPGERASITLLPYDRDFYALQQEGAIEFLISRNQIRRIYETADAVAAKAE
jgi:hypothetical protein